jgi:hypothetical protein
MQTLQEKIRDFLDLVPDDGLSLSKPEVLALSGAAFRTYVFVPDDNYNWTEVHPDQTDRVDALEVDNYGAFEALRVHTGWARREWNLKQASDLFALVKTETEAGRPLLRYGKDGKRALVTGIERERYEASLVLERDGETETLSLGSLKEGEEVLQRAGKLVTVREDRVDSEARRQRALTRDLLVWIARHHHCKKELAYDKDAYFAAGRRAMLIMAQRLLDEAKTKEAYPYYNAWLSEVIEARHAAAAFWETDTARTWLTSDSQEVVRDRAATMKGALRAFSAETADGVIESAEHATVAAKLLSELVSLEDQIAEALQGGGIRELPE